MDYVKSFNMFGVEAMQIPCLTGGANPTTATAGAPGMFYLNVSSGALFKCVTAKQGVYTWIAAGVPPVTKEDNGKILQVVNGEWVAVELGNAEEASF